MGYRCPVCEDPQADDVHLANHLAFTAVVRGGDHEAWLDDHVPEWGGMDDEQLAAVVTDHADEAEYPQVFEDTTSERHEGAPGESVNYGGDHGPGSEGEPPGHQQVADQAGEYEEFGAIADRLSDADGEREAREILEEARELTRRRQADDGVGSGDDDVGSGNDVTSGDDDAGIGEETEKTADETDS